jgi:hypothetical protein
VYLGLSETLTESNRTFTEEVFHRKKASERKGEMGGRCRAKRGSTMRCNFRAAWSGPSSPSSLASSRPFYDTSIPWKRLRPNFYGIFLDGGGGNSPLLLRNRVDPAAPRSSPRGI